MLVCHESHYLQKYFPAFGQFIRDAKLKSKLAQAVLLAGCYSDCGIEVDQHPADLQANTLFIKKLILLLGS